MFLILAPRNRTGFGTILSRSLRFWAKCVRVFVPARSPRKFPRHRRIIIEVDESCVAKLCVKWVPFIEASGGSEAHARDVLPKYVGVSQGANTNRNWVDWEVRPPELRYN